MRKFLSYFFMTLSALCFAMQAFAQGGTMTDASWVAITAGFSMAIASAVCGLAQGKATAAATEANAARSPIDRRGPRIAPSRSPRPFVLGRSFWGCSPVTT